MSKAQKEKKETMVPMALKENQVQVDHQVNQVNQVNPYLEIMDPGVNKVAISCCSCLVLKALK